MHSKWFTACTYLNFQCENAVSQLAWEPLLAKLRHHPILETQKESVGFSSPFGYLAPKVMSHEMQGFIYLTLTHEKKSIPRNKLNRLFMQKLEEQAEKTGVKITDIKGAERKSLKEATEAELLKKTIPDEVYINFIIDPRAKILFLDGTSKGDIDLIQKKLQQVDPTIKLSPFFDASLEIYLTQWLYDPGTMLPRQLMLDHEATLLNEEKAKATFSNQDLQSDELINLIKHDKKVTELGLLYDGRLNFKLNSKGCLKRLKPRDVLLSDVSKDLENAGAIEDREAHWLMMTNVIAELLRWFSEIFQVNNPNPAHTSTGDSAPAEPHTQQPATEPATGSSADDDGLDEAMLDLADALNH